MYTRRVFFQAFQPMRQCNFFRRKIHRITAWVVKSKGRQQEPAVPTAARLIGCGARAAAAAAADVGTHDVEIFPLSSGIS